MVEYINREAVRLAYEKSARDDKHWTEEASAVHWQEHRHILRVLDKIPAADVVKVVRCKDCKNGTLCINLNGNEYVDCTLDDYSVRKPDDFCSYGERK